MATRRIGSLYLPASLIVSGGIAAAMVATAFFGTLLAPYSPSAGNILLRLQGPSAQHWLGTDAVGRDELSRIIAGFAWSLAAAGMSTGVGILIGLTAGLGAVAFPGWPRRLVRRFLDFGIAFPVLVLAIAVLAVVGGGFLPLSLTLGVAVWPMIARLALAEGLVASEQEYVTIARLMGVGRLRRIIRHILPAMLSSLYAIAAFMFGDLIVLEAALSFLGLGAPLGTASWGSMLNDSQSEFMSSPLLMVCPAAAIVLVAIVSNVLGESLSRLTREGGVRRAGLVRASALRSRRIRDDDAMAVTASQ